MHILRHPHVRIATRLWAEHREIGNLAIHVIGYGLMTATLTVGFFSVQGRIPNGLPLAGTALSLGWIYVAVLLLLHAALDLLSAAMAGIVLLIVTAGGHAFDGPSGLTAIALLLLAFISAVFLIHAGHHVYFDFPEKHIHPAHRKTWLNTLYEVLFAWPLYILLFLLRRGYRPKLRDALVECCAQLYQPAAERPWQNWANTVQCTPATTFYPRTPDEIREIVRLARQEKRRIRVVGTAFSWSPLVPTNEFLVCLDLMRQIDIDLSDPQNPRAVVEVGANGRDLNRILEKNALAITSSVVMETVSWGGMISVGAHGSGWNEQTLSDLIEVVELIDSHGEVRRFERGKNSDEIMNAVSVSLGLFGVVYRITLRLVPAFNVRHQDRFVAADEVLANLEQWVPANEYLDLYWMPFNEKIWVRTWNRTTEPRTRRLPQRPWSGLSDRNHFGLWLSWFQTMGMRALDGLVRLRHDFVPTICRMKMALANEENRVVHINEATHFRSGIEAYRVGCAEFAFAIDPAFQNVRYAWETTTRAVDAWAARGRYPLNMVVNARFVRNSQCFLSPAHGNERTCYMEILGNHRNPDWKPFVNEVIAQWLKLPNIRPHWGKEHSEIPGIEEALRTSLETDLERFLQVRAQLDVDPEGMFVNSFLQRLLFDGLDKPKQEQTP